VARLEPTFLIIGAPKSGTTSLYGYLAQHPTVRPAIAKELSYFDRWYDDRSYGWYLAHFPRRTPGASTGEATPSYLYDPAAPGRIRAHLPGVKLIAVLRDPVRRAYSHYAHAVDIGFERLPLDEAIRREAQRLETDAAGPSHGWPMFAHRRFGYRERGIYHRYLRRWIETFPRSQILVIDSERLRTDLHGTLSEVASFVGTDPWVPAETRDLNVRRYGAMPADIEAELRRFYEPHDRELRELTGQYFGWMQRASER
jgi:hypothetical protein